MKILTHRFIARIIIEAETPLFVGSGNSSFLTDALVQKDANGLPMLPGTALAGVLRHSLEDFCIGDNGTSNQIDWKDIFGFQIPDSNQGLGSRFKISAGYFLLADSKVAETLQTIDEDLLSKIVHLPTRQHVRITDKGVADTANRGLFDNEVMYKGARFKFEVELKGNAEDEQAWKSIITAFQSPLFRIGQGIRNGYGKLKIIEIESRIYDLNAPNDYIDYLNHNPSLNTKIISSNKINEQSEKVNSSIRNGFLSYQLRLNPDDFFIFSEGFGDEQVDNKPVSEEVIVYKNGKINFEKKTLIPASSIKGALSHRVCFHYNKLKEWYADTDNALVGEDNPAVAHFFGRKGESKGNVNLGRRGNLIFSDLHFSDISNDKIFNHVAIDRFTSGAMDGALFSEKVSHKLGGEIVFDIHYVKPFQIQEIDDLDLKTRALEEALIDICKGLLPLGGMTTKGNGMFTGTLLKDGETIYSYV